MLVSGRKLREAWDDFRAAVARRDLALSRAGVAASTQHHVRQSASEDLQSAMAAVEIRRARLAETLVNYVEDRHRAYTVVHWRADASDLHGPIEASILQDSTAVVFARMRELSEFLRLNAPMIDDLRNRFSELRRSAENHAEHGLGATAQGEIEELDVIDDRWREDSEVVVKALEMYDHYEACVRRIAAVSAGLVADPVQVLPVRWQRKLSASSAVPIP
jgi:hypothetical protein